MGFPFGTENDPAAHESTLEGVRVGIGAPCIVVLGLIGTLVALLMSRVWGRESWRVLVLVPVWLIAGTLLILIVIPDRRVLMAVTYAPIFLIGAPFQRPPVSFLKAAPWPVIIRSFLVSDSLELLECHC